MNQSDQASMDLTCRCGRPGFAYYNRAWLCINCIRRKLVRLLPPLSTSSN